MSYAIYKYEASLFRDQYTFQTKDIFSILQTDLSPDLKTLTIWAYVDLDSEERETIIELYPTGAIFEKEHAVLHLETKIQGSFVWHLFLKDFM